MIRWIPLSTVMALHTRQIMNHGGIDGLRDQGLLESALARPENKHAYEGNAGTPDIPLLAAAYAYGVATNHCFLDGNKRIALMVSFVFLERNGWRMGADEEEAYKTFVALGAGEISEEDLTAWFHAHAVKT